MTTENETNRGAAAVVLVRDFLTEMNLAPEERPFEQGVAFHVSFDEFIARANCGLVEGSFELNFDSGAFSYRAGIDFTYNGLTAPLVRNIILSGMENIEDYAAELLEVVAGTMTPAAAALAAQSRVAAKQ
jgi:hypothetical protein